MMPARTILLSIFLFCLPFAGLAQTTLVKVNPLPLPLATLNIAVEQHFGSRVSVQLSAYLTKFRFKEADYGGWSITPEMRYYVYPTSSQPKGWYIAPFARYGQLNISREASQEQSELDGKAHFLGGGAVVGHQWLLGEKERVSIDVFAGPKYSKAIGVKGSASARDFEAGFILGGGFWVRSGITVGLAF